MALLIILLVVGVYYFKDKEFKQGSYHKVTKNLFLQTLFDPGRHGEYQIYRWLRHYEMMGGKFLFNCYLPKENGETTEIDALLINADGIFAFESKNYSGWIFGNEKDKNWTQTLPKGKGRSHKEHFMNPIIQNNVHIKWLRRIVGEEIPIHSVIVFSERCTLKNVQVISEDVKVINRNMIDYTVKEVSNRVSVTLSVEEINAIYDKLYPFTQVSEEQKLQHVQNIKRKLNNSQLNNNETRARYTNNKVNVQQNPSIKICPKCGAPLIIRTAKKGAKAGQQFYGCSSFPKCRYIC